MDTATLPSVPAFSLSDAGGRAFAFPAGRPALLCFVKEDCPTCVLSMPLIEAAHRSFGGETAVWAIGQDAAGNAKLVADHGLTLPMLDDSALAVSYACDLDTVPTIVLADASGAVLRQFVGFGRDDWRDLYGDLAERTGRPAPEIDLSAYPESRPGCGSKSVEPGIAERLAAEAEGSPLRARRIEIGEADDPFEFMFEQGLTDGLPVVPPTPERVLRMLRGTRRDAQDVVAIVPPNLAPATVEKVAANAVMAGCKPEYLPVVIAALEAICTDAFNIHGVMATTYGATPVMVVNGPIRHRIGMNMGIGALGSGNRANATIGRAVKLVLRNVGGAKPGGIERSTLASPGKYTMCFAEHEERSTWEPLHVERGFAAGDSVVTVFGIESSPRQIADQTSRTARALAGSFGAALAACMHPKLYAHGEALLVVVPEHVDTLARDGFTKDDVRARIQEVTARPLRELLADDDVGEGMLPRWFGASGPTEAQLAQPFPKFRNPKDISIVVAGGEAGKFSAVFGGWVSGTLGSTSVSRRIEEVP
jgi:hypothetical protein